MIALSIRRPLIPKTFETTEPSFTLASSSTFWIVARAARSLAPADAASASDHAAPESVPAVRSSSESARAPTDRRSTSHRSRRSCARERCGCAPPWPMCVMVRPSWPSMKPLERRSFEIRRGATRRRRPTPFRTGRRAPLSLEKVALRRVTAKESGRKVKPPELPASVFGSCPLHLVHGTLSFTTCFAVCLATRDSSISL
jgi:hypothetical protein